MDAWALLHLVTDPTRRAILAALLEGDRTVTMLVEATGGEQSNVSHHLRTLKHTGLVRERRAGRTMRYRLADPHLEELLRELDGLARRLEKTAYVAGLELPYGAGFHGYG